MNKKEQKLLLKVNQMDLWDLEEWQAGNPASSFSEEFIDEVNDLKEALECESQARREENILYYRQEDRISDDPEIR
tara:strand:+ start:259 stop:486 length:228 start_codon:yes stop_codon:yes gene_type:complete